MADYSLKNIPDGLWNQIRAIAKGNYATLRGTILKSLEAYVKDNGYIIDTQNDNQSVEENIEGDIF